MEIINTFLKYLAEAFADWNFMVVGIIIALIVGEGGIYFMFRNHKSGVSHKIAYRKIELLTKLEAFIQLFKTYAYSFDAETYNERKQSNESFLTSKSHQLNARLGDLYKMRAALKKKQFDDIDSVERALREINTYIHSTHGMMRSLSRKTSGKQEQRSEKRQF